MLFGHSTWDAVTTNVRAAEPDLTAVMDYPGQDYFDKFSVTDLGITPENTLKGYSDKGFHFKIAPERQVDVHISGPGAGASKIKTTLGPGDEIYRSGVDDKTHVKIGGVEQVFPGENETYYINFTNPLTVEPTGTDGDTGAGDVDDGTDDTGTGTDVTTQTDTATAVTEETKFEFPTKLAAIGGIILIGGFAATKMRKKRSI